MNELNICIAISPTQIKNFESIIKHENVNGDFVLLNPAGYNYDQKNWSKVINDTIDLGHSDVHFFNKIKYQFYKIKSYKIYIAKVLNEIPEQSKYNIYYCNLEDILNNFFFFSFRKKQVKYKILVEDGVLNYYERKITQNRYLFFLIKYVLCLIKRVKFKLFKGNITGIDFDEVKTQYVRIPNKAIFPEKSKQLAFNKISYEPNKKKLLFIGQDILPNLIGMGTYLERIEKYFEYIVEISGFDNEKELIYKPHRNGNISSITPLLKKYFGKNYLIIEKDEIIEDMVTQIRPYKIFSFSSSGLLNIRIATDDILDQKDIKFYVYPFSSNNTLKELFNVFEINIIE